MNGKIVVMAILVTALVAGGALYYLQVYGFYEDVTAEVEEIRLVPMSEASPQPIPAESIQAVDAESSPIRFRACFTTTASVAALSETFVTVDRAIPRNAPEWFECFDAAGIAAELEAGTAVAFLGGKNVNFGVDRIVAITDSGQGFIWHELNDCGEKAYDGTIVGEECPSLPERGE